MNNPIQKTTLAWRKLAEEAVVIDLSAERTFYRLSEVGATIWELCDGKTTISEMISAITAKFEVSADEAKNDVNEFLSELKRMQLLQ